MKLDHKAKLLTFGDLVTAAYDVGGGKKGAGILRLAVNAHLVEFQGQDRFVILEPEPAPIFHSHEQTS